MPSNRLLPIAAAAAMLTVLTACGGGSSAATAPPAATTSAASVPAATTPAAAASGAATIQLASTSLGMVLSDAQGRTLYMFVPDKSGASTCYDQCATAWPPVLTTGAPMAGTGIDASLLGTTPRTDGSVQVTYNKMPLYLFANDAAGGDVNGQGVKNVWYVIDAKGAVVKTAP